MRYFRTSTPNIINVVVLNNKTAESPNTLKKYHISGFLIPTRQVHYFLKQFKSQQGYEIRISYKCDIVGGGAHCCPQTFYPDNNKLTAPCVKNLRLMCSVTLIRSLSKLYGFYPELRTLCPLVSAISGM